MIRTIFGLLIKFEPKAFNRIRQILETKEGLLNKKTNWQEDGKLVMALILNRPDTDDEGRNNFFDHSVEEMIRSLREAGAEVQERKIRSCRQRRPNAPLPRLTRLLAASLKDRVREYANPFFISLTPAQ